MIDGICMTSPLLTCPPYCNHTTGHPPSHKIRSLSVALGVLVCFSLVELGVGLISHSLALAAEAGHMLSDGFVLALALLATWIARWPASPTAPFGYRRVEILAALTNGLGLLGVATWIGWEAVARLHAPPTEILSLPMLVTALLGLGINLINAALLHDDSHHDLNLRGAFLHMVADAISSIGIILAALAVWMWGWTWADGAISLGVAILIAGAALPLMRQSLHILLEKSPSHLDLNQLQTHLQSFAGVIAVTDLRVWTIALGQNALSAHLTVSLQEGCQRDRLLQQIQTSLQQEFDIQESFLQLAGLPVEILNPPLSERMNLSSQK
jgi:cobalt-zinc-cadmium efflux system protein